jgi:sugar lactone lactonase YvrE
MKAARLFVLFAALLLAMPLAGAAAEMAAPPLALPADWYPESIAAAADGSFYVGSWRQGAVARVRPGKAPQVLVEPGANGLANGQGVLVDAQARLLWICSGTMGFTTVPMTPSALKSYDLATGAPRGNYPLPDHGYCNDLVQDSRGTLYVTDSLHPRVLRLRSGDRALQVWKEDPAFAQGQEGFDLNGIALDGDGTLYVSEVTAADYLWRIPVRADGAPGAAVRVAMPRMLKNADAIRNAGAHRLVIFESDAFGHDGPYGGQISLATLAGDRATALVTLVRGLNDPSSGAIAHQRVYFIESKYGLLIAHKDHPQDVPAQVPFDVQSVALPR